ncbi:MAG TPA: cytochrome c oxidase subunit II, partial [Thermoanaerobaculia bacterium]|nr:cytochrome c oxidase subunit II [Thermoanaerobaculia bacterium]
MSGRRLRAAAATLAAAGLLAGCRLPRALDPAAPEAASIAGLWWVFFWVCTAVWALVVAALAAALLRRRGRRRELGAAAAGD